VHRIERRDFLIVFVAFLVAPLATEARQAVESLRYTTFILARPGANNAF